jgi:hypothetical protein
VGYEVADGGWLSHVPRAAAVFRYVKVGKPQVVSGTTLALHTPLPTYVKLTGNEALQIHTARQICIHLGNGAQRTCLCGTAPPIHFLGGLDSSSDSRCLSHYYTLLHSAQLLPQSFYFLFLRIPPLLRRVSLSLYSH